MIKVISNKTGSELSYQSFKFSGGEIHVKFDSTFEKSVKIIARLISSDDLIRLLLITDALKRMGIKINKVYIPYVPYARQDRVMVEGESLSIKVFANLINSQKYKKVIITDPHSEVTTALIDNCEIRNVNILNEIIRDNSHTSDSDGFVLVSPDAGALKKIYKAAELSNFEGEIITCSKHRDVKTGDIIDTIVPLKNSLPKTYVILDDICDGGRTFTEIAKKIKENSPSSKVILGVTHGIFSKGLDVLKQGGIDKVYSTNSFSDIKSEDLYLKQLDIINS